MTSTPFSSGRRELQEAGLGPDRGAQTPGAHPEGNSAPSGPQTRRECVRKQKGNENVIIRRAFARRPANRFTARKSTGPCYTGRQVRCWLGGGAGEAVRRGDDDPGGDSARRGLQTKPECIRKQKSCENVIPIALSPMCFMYNGAGFWETEKMKTSASRSFGGVLPKL